MMKRAKDNNNVAEKSFLLGAGHAAAVDAGAKRFQLPHLRFPRKDENALLCSCCILQPSIRWRS